MRKKISINGTEYWAESGTPLKPLLEEYGFAFPCGGTGRCGKCRIKCKEIPVSDLDRRFLTDGAIEEGWRLACDKKADEYVIECPAPARPPKARELSSCNIVAEISVDTIKISIADDEIAETVTVKNPIVSGDLSKLGQEYEENGKSLTKNLRAVLAKESIELFEKYGKAKAETFAIATNGLFASILTGQPLDAESDYNELADSHCFDLPTESVYFLPIINAYIGGDILSETVIYGENTLLLDCEEIFSAVSIGKDQNVAVAMWDMTYDEVGVKAVRAAIKTLREDGYSPFVRLYGEFSNKIEDVLLEEGLTYSFCKKKSENVAKVLQGLRFRAKLNKEKGRTSVLNILLSEEFHKYFSEEEHV